MTIRLNDRISIKPTNKQVNNPFLKVHTQQKMRESFGEILNARSLQNRITANNDLESGFQASGQQSCDAPPEWA